METPIYSEDYKAAVRKTLESLYVSEIDERFTANRAALFESLKPETEAVEDRLYSVFRQNADPVGRHRTRLAWLADFPDPGPPTNFALARQNFIERQYTALAAAERAAIQSFEAEYRNLVREEFEAIRQQYRFAYSSLLSDYYRELDLAKDKAVSRAEKITEPEPIPPAIEEFAARSYLFAGSEAATLLIPTVSAPRVSLDAGPVRNKIRERLEQDRAALFAKVNGLVLSRSAPRNATLEFHRWKELLGATP
ncbi:MAG: hypothetical protein KIT11_08270 [Fimbriimonadaceae bacterium]|nr:hypothetical protein [Fimbriimonadaceae bacterium]QYK56348.1 MAG: hypothetical protein KF733_02465 [Fimbriimonadaceae bacterium]